MLGVYWFATLVGWPFVFFFLVSGGDLDADFDVDTGLDLDTDLDADGLEATGAGPLSAILSFLSFRAIAFFAAFFGLAGLLLTWVGAGSVLTLVLALGLGLFAFWLNGILLRYLKASSSDSSIRDSDIEGNPATVTLPVGPGRRGRVAVDVRGQRLMFTASPYSEHDETSYDVGASVVIVEIDSGTARIAPLDVT